MKISFLKLILLLIFISGIIDLSYAQDKDLPVMVLIKGGTFQMGSSTGQDDEKPAHSVTLSDFFISKFEITVGQYKQFCTETKYQMPALPNKEWYEEYDQVGKWIWKNDNPIVNVTWNDAMAYCKWLAQKTGQKYTLPTEAQWEYTARGGSSSKSYKYCGSNNINEVCWYDETTHEKGTRPVGKLKPNELGIFDMSGNAWEWCLDKYAAYTAGASKDPQGAVRSNFYVIRGGGWFYTEDMCTVFVRDGPKPADTNYNYGFRIARIP